MKKIFTIAAMAFLFSCSNESTKTAEAVEAKASEAKPTLPYPMSYEAVAETGKTDNVASVMKFNGDFIAGNLDNIGSYFADSVTTVFTDGKVMNTIRDSAVAMIKGWRGSMKSAKQDYISAIAVNNKLNGDEWVFQWINESYIFKDGKEEHHTYHEDYRLLNGKIRYFYQYEQGIPASK